jgi:hypothetical protein
MVGPRGTQKAVPLEEVVRRAAVFVNTSAPNPQPTARPEPKPQVTPPQPQAEPQASLPVHELQGLLQRVTRAEQDTSLLERLVQVEARAAQAEAESAYLRLRLEDAYAEIEQLRRHLAVLLEPPARG